MFTWKELDFWNSEEWKDIQERLDVREHLGLRSNPRRDLMFKCLDCVPFEDCKVCFVGQDPYPLHRYCTGIAFSIPVTETKWPSALCQLFAEYTSDLGTANAMERSVQPKYTTPKTGDLTKWCDQGVLMINSTWTCSDRASLSHYNWPWNYLTQEIIERLAAKPQGCVFVFLGARAREFVQYVDPDSRVSIPSVVKRNGLEYFDVYPTGERNFIIETSHPSPRAYTGKRVRPIDWTPFKGSRIFTTINQYLIWLHHTPIDWRLE